MTRPNGETILSKLIELYAKQENVKINCKIEEKEKNRETNKR